MPTTLDHLDLFKELQDRAVAKNPIAIDLASRLNLLAPHVDNVLADIRVFFRHFTDHSIDHSFRIISLLASRFCHSRQRFWAARTLPPLLRDTKSLCPEHAYALDII